MMKKYIKLGLLILVYVNELSAQTVNIGDLSIAPNTLFATVSDFNNTTTGDVLNDGNFIVYKNFKNDGLVTYSTPSNGKTLFTGSQIQLIDGSAISNFQNVVFENPATAVPFHLAADIAVGNQLEFKKGIIDAAGYDGKVIFNQNAFHSGVSDLSFVDGIVEKKGIAQFEFPVGDAAYFRPSYHAAGTDQSNVYDTQYFFTNAGATHPYTSKEDIIVSIDPAEYWNITQTQGGDKIVLSLSLDPDTTPANFFFDENPDTKLSIVRWDTVLAKWVDEGGVTTDAASTQFYTTLVTSQVKGYGLFAVAIVKKTITPPITDIVIHNGISPNGDGINDKFVIEGITQFPDNRVEIFNRWGVKVYDQRSYNESDVMFTGYSDGRVTVNKKEKLPTGTYFYIVTYTNGRDAIEKSGYLYINNQ